MDTRDPFPRRTASPTGLAPWFVELGRNAVGLAAAYADRQALDPRTREQVILAVTEVNGCRYCAWIHGSWRDFLGAADPIEAEEAVLAYARASAEAGRPLDPEQLAEVLPPASVRAVRATVAQIEISNLVGNTVDGLIARATRKRPFDLRATVTELATVAAALPLAVPLLALAAGMDAVNRAAPAEVNIDMPAAGEANLLVHVVAETLRPVMANAAVRLALAHLPSVAIALRAGRTPATVRIGRGRIVLRNGVTPDATLVIEGDVGPLLRLASGALTRSAVSLRVRPA